MKLGSKEVCINNTENKYDINENNMDTDKDMLKLSIEESKISATPSDDSENSATLYISVNDPILTTLSSPPIMENLPLADPITKNQMLIVGLASKNYMKHHELSMKMLCITQDLLTILERLLQGWM